MARNDNNTLSLSNAKDKLAGRTGLDALNALFGDMDEVHAEDQSQPAPEPSIESPPTNELLPLAKVYLANAISALTRMPSPNLKNADFRATLNHWREVLIVALKTADEPTAFVNAVLAIVEGEGTFEAARMIRNVSQQLLWQASLDVQRDRRTAGDVANQSTFQDGEEDHIDSDAVVPPTEDEALDAYVEAHGWLGMIADLLPVDDDDRARLGLDSGLEFTQVKEGDNWVRVYGVNDAIEIQLQKNRDAMKRRDAAKVLAKRDTFAALARLAKAA